MHGGYGVNIVLVSLRHVERLHNDLVVDHVLVVLEHVVHLQSDLEDYDKLVGLGVVLVQVSLGEHGDHVLWDLGDLLVLVSLGEQLHIW